MTESPRPCRGRSARRGAALLEVVIALSILLVAMAVIGVAFRNGQHHIEMASRMSRAAQLTEQILVQLDVGAITLGSGPASGSTGGVGGGVTEQTVTGYFGEDALPNMSYRVSAVPLPATPDMYGISVEILQGDPEGAEESHELILATHVLRAVPRPLNMQEDFGVSEEQVEQITNAVPGGSAVFDPTNFDPRALASLDMDTLIQMLPLIMEALGGQLGQGQLDQLMQAAQSGDMQQIQDMTNQLKPPQDGGDAGTGPPTRGDQGGDGQPVRPSRRSIGERMREGG